VQIIKRKVKIMGSKNKGRIFVKGADLKNSGE